MPHKPRTPHKPLWCSGIGRFGGLLWSSLRDLLPIIVVIAVFQIFVFGQRLENLGQLLIGLTLVVIGLTLFVLGLEIGLFPLGQQMAHDFARKGSVGWLIAFAFALGFGSAFAEPALITVTSKAAALAVVDVDSQIAQSLQKSYALSLRTTVACSVGIALIVGVVRILLGWPLHYFFMIGYAMVMLLTMFAPANIIAVAYDSGGVTTSTITVPLTAALGVGLASSIKGRDPLSDGFGLIAFAALMPILFVLVWGVLRS
jgi:hypothetical protein